MLAAEGVMRMDLDFTGLTDDQLVGLIRAACEEAVTRGAAVEMAARAEFLSAAERVQVARAAAERETERLRREETERVAAAAASRSAVDVVAERERQLWAQRKGIAQALDAAGWNVVGDQLVVWLSDRNEKRVFLQQNKYDGTTWVTLYVTGNAKHAPGSCLFDSKVFKGEPELKREVGAVLRAVAAAWNAIKIDLPQAISWKGDAVPLAGYTPPPPAIITPPPAAEPAPAAEASP